MKKKELLEMLNKLEEIGDIDFYDDEGTIYVDFNDYIGFYEDGEPIAREYGNEGLVYQVLNFLEKNCKNQEGNYYTKFIFDDFKVIVGYSSFNI